MMTDARVELPIIEVIGLTRTIQTPTHRVEILRGIDDRDVRIGLRLRHGAAGDVNR